MEKRLIDLRPLNSIGSRNRLTVNICRTKLSIPEQTWLAIGRPHALALYCDGPDLYVVRPTGAVLEQPLLLHTMHRSKRRLMNLTPFLKRVLIAGRYKIEMCTIDGLLSAVCRRAIKVAFVP